VVQRFDGHIAQLLGDALLVYFGWPQAHEDDAQRAVRTGLGMLEAMGTLNARLERDKGIRLAIRVGIHTGLVVVGEMGGGGHLEQLALGETPNIASRIQGMTEPDTIVISEATYRLIEGYFICQKLGEQPLKGVAEPMPVYRVLHETEAQTRFEVMTSRGLTPLVGREDEVTLLMRRWTLSTEGQGQVMLLSGEGGIGKSRLVEVQRQRAESEGCPRIAFRCSLYHINSALYPVIQHVQRLLHFQPDDAPETKLDKLERVLTTYSFRLEEVVPLFAVLLSVPLADRYAPLNLSPQRQRRQTLDALVAWLLAEAARQPILVVWEDLHWADPSTLELLTLLIEQVATARMLTLLTFRPSFHPSWAMAAHITHLTLNRFTPQQVERMATHVAGDKSLPAEVIQQVVAQTDGVPLFAEELTKTVLESGILEERDGHYELTGPLQSLAIPATLHDALTARLDRLGTAKAVAQLGATLGRTFTYELLQAVSPLDETTLQQALPRLVEAELLAQRGTPPQATYTFKHVLIQDAAYQSLLKTTRQQHHQRIARVLAERFPETVATQPELLAHHYTEARLTEQAISHWHLAGDHATQRSANQEAIGHFGKALELLTTLPDTPERVRHALTLHVAVAERLEVTRGMGDPDVERAYTRAHELCRQVEDSPLLTQVLMGLFGVYINRAELQQARELAERLLSHAQRQNDPTLLLVAYRFLGQALFEAGEIAPARARYAQGMALYELRFHPQQQQHDPIFHDAGARCPGFAARPLWHLGYPAQSLARIHQALSLAQELSRPYVLGMMLIRAACIHQYRREVQAVRERAETAMTLCREHGFAQWLVMGTHIRGWALAMQGQAEEGIAQMCQSLATWRAMGLEVYRPYFLALLAEAYGTADQNEAGLTVLAEALDQVGTTGQRVYEAELYRLKGTLLLARPGDHHREAEVCFQKALDVARRQQAKSWELRAATSLARLWQSQAKRQNAYDLLAPVYGWFTEGFDMADLQEAKALLDACVER
jgi:predicted ATPase